MLSQIILNGIIAGSNYVLIALGFSIIYKTVRFFHFAHGAVYVTGVYFAYSLSVLLGMNLILSCLFASIFSAIFGMAIDRIVYCPLRKKNAPPLVFLVASFGVFLFIQNLIQLAYGTQVLALRMEPPVVGYKIISTVITPIQILIIFISIAIFAFVWLFVDRTKVGKALRAVADDPIGASVSGIYPERIILFAFGIGSAIAGVASVLIALETYIEPTMGLNAIFKGIIAAVIGGIGSIPGALIGGLFLGIIENIGIWKISAGWKDTIAFAVLIMFLLIRPEGILGKKNNGERL